MTRVHQATGAVGPYDAVTGQVVAYRELLERWGMAGGTHAARIAPGAPAGIEPLERLDPAPDDLVLVHYSGWVPGMQPLLEPRGRTLLVYHNVTPARWFWRLDPRMAQTCELGRDHLPAAVRAATATAAVSEFNAGELRDAGARDPHLVHILLDPTRLAPPGGAGRAAEARVAGDAADTGRGGGPLVLSVGRLTPHKRPDLAIRAFALYQRHRCPDARLLCAGVPLSRAYLERLEQLARDVGARGVTLAPGLPQRELNAAYAEASAFVSLSEHEGFCVPLLEALASGVPAVARPAGGMPEVGGDAVLWADGADPALAAELIHLAVSEPTLRAELAARSAARAEHFSPDRVAGRIRAAIDAALA